MKRDALLYFLFPFRPVTAKGHYVGGWVSLAWTVFRILTRHDHFWQCVDWHLLGVQFSFLYCGPATSYFAQMIAATRNSLCCENHHHHSAVSSKE